VGSWRFRLARHDRVLRNASMSAGARRSRFVLGIVMIVLAAAALRDLSRLGDALPWRTMDEFADFYCAGSVLDRGASPYTYEPLRTCEHLVNVGKGFRAKLFRNDFAVAVPAPQPAYDFAPFMALARLPYGEARVIDALAILSAAALSALFLVLLGIPWQLAVAALGLSVAYVELNTAQIVPFALLALAVCGFALSRGRDALAGIAAALTAIEPTAGIPVVAAMLCFVPRARWAVALSAFALALIAFAVVGWHGVVLYATGVLPAHSASELRFPFQYGLTYALAYFGLSPLVAGIAGILSYFVLLGAGLYIAPRATAALQRRELLAFIPALCAVIAGPFLHQEELCFALPALLVFAVETRGTARTLSAIALCVLSIPWILVWGMKQLFLAALFVCAVILLRLRIAGYATLAILFAVAGAIYLLELHPPHLQVPTTSQTRAYAPNELVQREWRDYTEARSTSDFGWFAIKLPTWAALIATLAIAAGLKPRSRAASEPNPENWRETQHPPTA
jgi:hypothetical protein